MMSISKQELGEAIKRAQADATMANQAVATALARLEKHEGICTERQGTIIQNVTELKNSMRSLWKYLISAGAALIAGMAWLIVDLTIRGKLIP